MWAGEKRFAQQLESKLEEDYTGYGASIALP
jgi:hypothetical protein